jgi:signal transduction histidine kinase
MRIGRRLFLAVLPAVLGVLSVAGLAYWGRYQRQVPEAVLAIAMIASLGSLWMAWRNARYVAQRIERLAGGVVDARDTGREIRSSVASSSAVSSSDAPRNDELDSIEHVVDRLSSAVTLAADQGRKQERAADERVREYAALLAETSAAVARQLEEVRLPLHILLESKFGDLNENQEEMLAAARAAADTADLELQRLRQIASIDGGALSLRRDPVHSGDLLRALLPTLQAQGEREGVRVSADLAPALPRVYGDRVRLQEALSLLLGERVRHAPSESEVRISADANAQRLRVVVQHGAAPHVSAEEVLGRRLLAAHDGTIQEDDGRTTLTLPTG